MMLNLRDIEYFSTILDTGSVSRAAEKLHVSQPSLSQYLIRLEERIGDKLFDRTHSPWQLTDVGNCFLDYINEFNQINSKLSNEIQSIKNGNSIHQTISIGIPPWKGTLILPQIINQYADKFPNVTIKVFEEGSLQLVNRLLSGDISFGIMITPSYDKYIVYEKLIEERILLAVNKDHPQIKGIKTSLENPSYFDISKLYNQRIIIPGPNQILSKEVNSLFIKYKIKPERLLYLNNILTCLNLSALGYGYTFVPELGIKQYINFDKLAFFSPDKHDFTWSLCIAYKNPHDLNNASKELIKIIKENFSR